MYHLITDAILCPISTCILTINDYPHCCIKKHPSYPKSVPHKDGEVNRSPQQCLGCLVILLGSEESPTSWHSGLMTAHISQMCKEPVTIAYPPPTPVTRLYVSPIRRQWYIQIQGAANTHNWQYPKEEECSCSQQPWKVTSVTAAPPPYMDKPCMHTHEYTQILECILLLLLVLLLYRQQGYKVQKVQSATMTPST